MPLLTPSDQRILRDKFDKELQKEVTITLYTQGESRLDIPSLECPSCQQTRGLLEEVVSLSPKLRLEVLDLVAEGGRAQKEGVDKVPALILDKAKRLRFYGLPLGYEFATIIEGLLDVSKGTTSLSESTREALKKLGKPVHIQVFVTTTCPWCPLAARLAHQMALESPQISADVIEVTEFPHLAQRYQVQGVPKVVINEKVQFEGAQPEARFLSYVLAA